MTSRKMLASIDGEASICVGSDMMTSLSSSSKPSAFVGDFSGRSVALWIVFTFIFLIF